VLKLGDRLVTIAATAALTSAVWIAGEGGFTRLAADRAPAPRPALTSTPTPATADPRALIIPVEGVKGSDLTDTFTDARGGGTRVHKALDILAPEGAAVIAAAPGTVEKLFYSDKGGKTIYVRSPDRTTIDYYAHLSAYAPGLAEGQQVARGQRIGSVGHTGDASAAAPHLHIEIMRTTPQAKWWDPATSVNPYPLLKALGPSAAAR
jgi:murein DD-endopeptidase MepM/ murein hydrolase activator NlpD